MDYKKKYEAALERAKIIEKESPEWWRENQGAITEIFPELADNDEERIRKDIIRFLEVAKEDRDAPFFEMAIAYLEKQKEPLPIPDKFSGLKSLMLQYLQSASNRKDDTEIESDTDLWGRKILDYVWKYDEKQKEQKPASISCAHENDKPADDKAFEEWNDTDMKEFIESM